MIRFSCEYTQNTVSTVRTNINLVTFHLNHHQKKSKVAQQNFLHDHLRLCFPFLKSQPLLQQSELSSVFVEGTPFYEAIPQHIHVEVHDILSVSFGCSRLLCHVLSMGKLSLIVPIETDGSSDSYPVKIPPLEIFPVKKNPKFSEISFAKKRIRNLDTNIPTPKPKLSKS